MVALLTTVSRFILNYNVGKNLTNQLVFLFFFFFFFEDIPLCLKYNDKINYICSQSDRKIYSLHSAAFHKGLWGNIQIHEFLTLTEIEVNKTQAPTNLPLKKQRLASTERESMLDPYMTWTLWTRQNSSPYQESNYFFSVHQPVAQSPYRLFV